MYSAPTVKLSNNQTATTQLDWDPVASAIVVTIPEPRSAPLVLALALGLKYIELKGDKGKFSWGIGRSTPEPTEKTPKDPSLDVSKVFTSLIVKKCVLTCL